MFYRHIRLVEQSKNMLKKLNIQLVLIFHQELSVDVHDHRLKQFLNDHEVVYLTSGNPPITNGEPERLRNYIDYALDRRHPGTLQHSQWANEIIEYLK
jgi:hypothetical protein